MGAIADNIAKVRLYVDEPAVNTKFTNAILTGFIRSAWAEIMRDINSVADNKIRARYDITIVADQHEHALPPSIGEFLSFEKYNDDGLLVSEVIPRHPLNPVGPGLIIEGPMLYLDPTWNEGETMRITYVPNGDVPPHDSTAGILLVGTSSGTTLTGVTTMTVAAAPTTGDLDGRLNAYAGYVLRILTQDGDWTENGANTEAIVQERVITAYDNTTRKVTFAPTLDPLPGWSADTPPTLDDANTSYEILPLHFNLCEEILALLISRKIAAAIADRSRMQTLNLEYQNALRAVRLTVAQMEQRAGSRFIRSVRGRRSR